MATTEQKPGFRLPWSSDQPTGLSATDPEGGSTPPTGPAADALPGTDLTSGPTATSGPPEGPPVRRPNRLMAELTKAMQAAAEASREEALNRLNADAKACVELIRAGSVEGATTLRQQADADVAAVRDWSKAEIARIREETEARIADRKSALEREVEAHAVRVEQRVERVQARVASFEAEMAAFFEALLAEDDPTRFAGLAESLPEPPDLEDELDTGHEPAAALGAFALPGQSSGPAGSPVEPTAADATSIADAPIASPQGAIPGLTAETAEAAEAEAFVVADLAAEDEIATISEDAIAARLAGFTATPDAPRSGDGAGDRSALGQSEHQTRVFVTGLVSVASIAGFKRQLGRLAGVQSVGVSSGPGGEFVFAVAHAAGLSLRDAVPTFQGFQARITAADDGGLHVSAHDPESQS